MLEMSLVDRKTDKAKQYSHNQTKTIPPNHFTQGHITILSVI